MYTLYRRILSDEVNCWRSVSVRYTSPEMASQSQLADLHSKLPEVQPPCSSSSKFSVGFSRRIAMAPLPLVQPLSSSSLAAEVAGRRFWNFRRSSTGNVQLRRDVAVKSHLKLNLPLISPHDQWGNWTVLFSIGAFGIWWTFTMFLWLLLFRFLIDLDIQLARQYTESDSISYHDSGNINSFAIFWVSLSSYKDYGSTSLESDDRLLNLENTFCMYDITKKLSSVSKLAQDNNVYLEFHSDCCLVKDTCMGKVMLMGVLKDGLYRLGIGDTGSASIFSKKLLIKLLLVLPLFHQSHFKCKQCCVWECSA